MSEHEFKHHTALLSIVKQQCTSINDQPLNIDFKASASTIEWPAPGIDCLEAMMTPQ
jgi:hypothetical protein